MNAESFLAKSKQALQAYEEACCDDSAMSEAGKQSAARILELASESVESPLQRLEHSLHPWVIYAIMPIFALANAGVAFGGGDLTNALASPMALGVYFRPGYWKTVWHCRRFLASYPFGMG